MTTKFLLHGGMLKYDNVGNDSYFQELTKNLKDGDKVLFIGFARPTEEERKQVYKRDKGYILAQAKSKIDVLNATHDNLIDQTRAAKAIHITGGETDILVADIQRHPDFIDAIKGKVIGGSSAGASLFSKYYFFCNKQKILKGLGTLPICILVHYGNEEYCATDRALELLKPYAKNLELLAIKECEWVTRRAEL